MKNVKVGMFNLPGISLREGYTELDANLVKEITAWGKENHCGTCMGPGLWSFRNEKQREWFVLRWSDSIGKFRKSSEE